MERYIATKKELLAKGESKLAIVKAFMKSKRAIQKQITELMGSKESSSKDSGKFKGLCFNCNQEGHKQVECSNEATGDAMRSHGTVSRFCNTARLVSHCNHIVPHLLGRGQLGAPTLKEIVEVDSVHSLFQLQMIPFQNRFVDQVSTFFDQGPMSIW